MSEISNHLEERYLQFRELFYAISNKRDAVAAVRKYDQLVSTIEPLDIILLVHRLVEESTDMETLKTGINKFLNVCHKALMQSPADVKPEMRFLHTCKANNAELEKRLNHLRSAIKKLNADPLHTGYREECRQGFMDLQKMESYYLIKENILFPLLEKHWPNYKCLGVMWSFHDDIRRSLSGIISLLAMEDLDMKQFNRLTGDLYFSTLAIRFREERILFPYIIKTLPTAELDDLLEECSQFGFPYVSHSPETVKNDIFEQLPGSITLGTGNLSPEQLILMLNHLPVDITFVDEEDKVRYFSSPAHRIFPRSKAILGRDVHNCHPPESVHIVHEIIEKFRNGQRDVASFWIQTGNKMILIRYYALRDPDRCYRGVLEVSQEISDIRRLEGEQRLLDWDVS